MANELPIPHPREIHAWSARNYPVLPDAGEVVGLVEEVGELCRAVNKRAQGVRGSFAYWTDEIAKEMGDIYIKLADISERLGFDLFEEINKRWATVSQRRDKDGYRPDEAA